MSGTMEASAPKVEAPEYAPKVEGATAASKKKKSKNKKTLVKRGPTALPDNRGCGFEGMVVITIGVPTDN